MPEPTEEPSPPTVVRGHRRGVAWVPVAHGLYRRQDGGAVDVRRAELAAWSLALPPVAAFTHLTGAELRGWQVPPPPRGLPVLAAMSCAGSRPQRRGLRVLRRAIAPALTTVDGLPVDASAEILLACARHLSLVDLVVLIDSALQLGDVTIDEVADLAGSGRPGSRALRRALAHADGRSESAYETLLRLLHGELGVEVEPQRVLTDEFGGFVARGDLWLVGTRTFHEYDGAEHRNRPRHRHDLRRERAIGHQEWTRRGYTSVEVVHQAITILRDCDTTLGRRHDPSRVRGWHELLRESCFTTAGRARLAARLGHDGSASAREW